METEHRLNGSLRYDLYPLYYGQINIETYGLFFYNETESGFLLTLNRFLFVAGLIFTLWAFLSQ
ncbi:MAG: hypothetical protein LBT95_08625 [Treponema sp.]|jgi:hypothetical protein|nr:hypothetical protein [Treponema sp.]